MRAVPDPFDFRRTARSQLAGAVPAPLGFRRAFGDEALAAVVSDKPPTPDLHGLENVAADQSPGSRRADPGFLANVFDTMKSPPRRLVLRLDMLFHSVTSIRKVTR